MKNAELGNTPVIVLGVVVLLIIVGYFVISKNFQQISTVSTPQSAISQPTDAGAPTALTNSSDTSNSQLDQDLSTIGKNLNKLNQNISTSDQTANNQSQDTPAQ